MARTTDETKQGRKERVWLYVQRHPHGITETEIAEFCGFDRRSINNYLRELETEGKLFKDKTLWLPLDYERTRLRSFDLQPEEAMALYLGARLLVKQYDKRSEPVESALLKLAQVLTADAGVGQEIEQAAHQLAERPVLPGYQPVFQTMVRGYLYRRQVELRYQPLNAPPFDTLFSTYLIEPSPVGFSTYLIGYSGVSKALRSYKLERIVEARLTPQAYTIPPDFPGLEILKNAWSIIFGGEPRKIVLRFSAQVAQRVRETRWHPSQTLEPDPAFPGSLLWTAEVADFTDMLTWLKGWGAELEVLEPPELRSAFQRAALRLVEVYQAGEEPVKKFLAHLRKKDKVPQYLSEHLGAVSALTGKFTEKIGLKEVGAILGLFHDLGKASREFQNYIRSATGLLDPDEDQYVDAKEKKGKVDHSSAGAQAVYTHMLANGSEKAISAQVLALCIASHHSGVIDCLTPEGENNFQRRMEKPEEQTHTQEALANLDAKEMGIFNELITKMQSQILLKVNTLKEPNDSRETMTFKIGLLIRCLFSCLIDADRLDTAGFELPKDARLRNHGRYLPWSTLIQRLDQKLTELENLADKNPIDGLRTQVSQDCLAFAVKPKGLYQLKVPTGGGKTLASLRFALNHAEHHKLERIFYIVPFTSIIDQNADQLRKVLEAKDAQGNLLDQVVLEHHSNLTPEEETRRQHLLSENWDAPVVFTTQVQFLETLFGAGTRNARRMHQLVNAVIIFDEVQTIPVRCVHMFNLALRFLVQGCGSTVVLCTATQPLLDKIEPQQRALTITTEQSIVSGEQELFRKLKRVEVFDRRKAGGWSDAEVADLVAQELSAKGSVLVVVNTRNSARFLYQSLVAKGLTEVYHLSTRMCPAHRLEVLDQIREKLANRQPVVCVSTQLIEAGVDVDFGVVVRYLAGLDSIVQAAGRCNRNGKQVLGNVWIVNPGHENIDKLADIRMGIKVTERLLDDFKDHPEAFDHDLLGLKAIEEFYKNYFYARKNEMAYPVGKDSPVGREDDLFNLLSTNTVSVSAYQRITHSAPTLPFKQSFQTAAKAFQAIDSNTRGVVVPYHEEGIQIVTELCGAYDLELQYKLVKRAQRYSVNLFAYEFDQLAKQGAIREVQKDAGIFYLDAQYYDEQFGWGDEAANPMPLIIC